jgi:hypothetical protein
MSKSFKPSPTSLASQSKDKDNLTQLKTILHYLSEHTATASMVADATGIYQKNICRYKRDLEKAGRLWETEKKLCKVTGFRAWYLSANPDKAPKQKITQIKLF